MTSTTFYASAAAMAIAVTLAAPITAGAAEAMRVVRDPQTGELRGPTAAEAAAFQKAEAQLRAARTGKNAVSTTPSEITYPDGTVETPLGEDTMMSSVARLRPDGSLRYDCVPAKEAKGLTSSSRKSSVRKAGKADHDHQ